MGGMTKEMGAGRRGQIRPESVCSDRGRGVGARSPDGLVTGQCTPPHPPLVLQEPWDGPALPRASCPGFSEPRNLSVPWVVCRLLGPVRGRASRQVSSTKAVVTSVMLKGSCLLEGEDEELADRGAYPLSPVGPKARTRRCSEGTAVSCRAMRPPRALGLHLLCVTAWS